MVIVNIHTCIVMLDKILISRGYSTVRCDITEYTVSTTPEPGRISMKGMFFPVMVIHVYVGKILGKDELYFSGIFGYSI